MDNSKPTKEEVKDLIESFDFLDREEIEKLITKMYWKLEKERKELWKCERAYP